jgi:hypothetical protein
MKQFIRKIIPFFLLLLVSPAARSQSTELFFNLQTGSPFRVLVSDNDGAPVIWNYCFGAEQYMIDKLSLSLAYRKSFYLEGKEAASQPKIAEDMVNHYSYTYREDYDIYSVDFEAKYFFEEPDDDGIWMSSGISMQHLTMNLTVLEPVPNYNNTGTTLPVLNAGEYSEGKSIYPLGMKWGHRTSGDVAVFDYYCGLYYHLGAKGTHRRYENVLQYYEFKEVSFVVGMKLGFKF